MIDDYFTQLENRLKLGTGLADKTFDTLRLDAEGGLIHANYVVLFTPTMDEFDEVRFTAEVDANAAIPFEVELRVIGTKASTARKLLSAATDQFIGYSVQIEGRQLARLRPLGTTQVQPDVSVKPFLYWASARFAWISRPAP
jgi:hypothetical protein